MFVSNIPSERTVTARIITALVPSLLPDGKQYDTETNNAAEIPQLRRRSERGSVQNPSSPHNINTRNANSSSPSLTLIGPALLETPYI
eukprot:2296234-Amphidinium_carterae.1